MSKLLKLSSWFIGPRRHRILLPLVSSLETRPMIVALIWRSFILMTMRRIGTVRLQGWALRCLRSNQHQAARMVGGSCDHVLRQESLMKFSFLICWFSRENHSSFVDIGKDNSFTRRLVGGKESTLNVFVQFARVALSS